MKSTAAEKEAMRPHTEPEPSLSMRFKMERSTIKPTLPAMRKRNIVFINDRLLRRQFSLDLNEFSEQDRALTRLP